MTDFSDYNICITKMHNLKTVKDYREFAERVVEHFGCRLIWFGVGAVQKLFFGYSKTRQYSKAKSTYFDEVSLTDLGGLDFGATNVKRSRSANLILRFSFRHDTGLVFVTLVLDSDDEDDDLRFNQTESFIDLIQSVSDIKFVLADRMASEKWVDAFASGIGHGNRRSNFENEVAFSISACKREHHKIPYLFAYSYMKLKAADIGPIPEQVLVKEKKGYTTVIFPRCFGKKLSCYPSIPEWLTVYETLKETSVMEVKERLDAMVLHYSRTDAAKTEQDSFSYAEFFEDQRYSV